jgi:hypothetical protein
MNDDFLKKSVPLCRCIFEEDSPEDIDITIVKIICKILKINIGGVGAGFRGSGNGKLVRVRPCPSDCFYFATARGNHLQKTERKIVVFRVRKSEPWATD